MEFPRGFPGFSVRYRGKSRTPKPCWRGCRRRSCPGCGFFAPKPPDCRGIWPAFGPSAARCRCPAAWRRFRDCPRSPGRPSWKFTDPALEDSRHLSLLSRLRRRPLYLHALLAQRRRLNRSRGNSTRRSRQPPFGANSCQAICAGRIQLPWKKRRNRNTALATRRCGDRRSTSAKAFSP